MSIGFFENTEYTLVRTVLNSANNPNGKCTWFMNEQQFVHQRKLIAYSSMAYYTQGGALVNTLMNWAQIEIEIEQPTNVTQPFTLASSNPIGGLVLTFTPNSVILPGQTTAVSILPLPLTIMSVFMSTEDIDSTDLSLFMDLTLFWETKKRDKFVGE